MQASDTKERRDLYSHLIATDPLLRAGVEDRIREIGRAAPREALADRLERAGRKFGSAHLARQAGAVRSAPR